MKNIYYIILVAILIAIGCQKQESFFPFKDNDEVQCLSGTMFTCEDIAPEVPYYFKGIINKFQACYGIKNKRNCFTENAELDLYILPSQASQFPGPRAEFGIRDDEYYITDHNYHVYFTMAFPDDSFGIKMLDKYLKVGELPLRKKSYYYSSNRDSIVGFSIEMRVMCALQNLAPGCQTCFTHEAVDFTSTGGDMTNSYLRCKEVIRTEDDDKVTYDVKLEMQCKLYRDKEGKHYWADLEKGEFSTRIEVPKHI